MLKNFRRRANTSQAASTTAPADAAPSTATVASQSSSSAVLSFNSAMTAPSSDEGNDDINSSAYAARWRALMDLHKALNDLGAEAFFPLPRITVIGGQSAGKSSLVEAVSGLSVPRDAGICTRCPMECVMKKTSGPWSCRISLRTGLEPADVANGSPSTVDFGPAITCKEDVDIWLRRAQAAILSPHRAREGFYDKSPEQLKAPDEQRLAFSRNTIVVNLEDEDLTNMSFVDLPGLIQNSEQRLIDLVRDLVADRIEGKNTIVLVTVPMTDDVETVAALKLAREADPAGQRTIAVLTKPDLIRQGATSARERWPGIMEGKEPRHKLHHGYFAVLLPNDDDRTADVSKAAIRARSHNFFSTEQPWKAMGQQRFGVVNLVSYVGSLLVRLIENAIPELRKAIANALRLCQEELATLPAEGVFNTDSDVNTYIVLQITKFCELFSHAVMGEPSSPHKDLVQANRRHYEHLKLSIGRTRPDFWPFEDKNDYRSPGFGHGDGTGPMDLKDVREVIDKSIAWELPRHIPFEATKVLIMRITARWSAPALKCAADVVETTDAKLLALIQSQFGQFQGLKEHVESVVARRLAECAEPMDASLATALKLETGQPIFTQNTHYLETVERKWLGLYRSAHYHSNAYCVVPYEQIPTPCVSAPPSPQLVQSSQWPTRPRTPPLVRRTRADEELEVMSKVYAYVQVAYKRIIDHVPLLLEHEFNQTLAEGLLEPLLRSVDAMSDDAKRAMLAEDKEVADRRVALKAKHARLVAIQRKLDDWEKYA